METHSFQWLTQFSLSEIIKLEEFKKGLKDFRANDEDSEVEECEKLERFEAHQFLFRFETMVTLLEEGTEDAVCNARDLLQTIDQSSLLLPVFAPSVKEMQACLGRSKDPYYIKTTVVSMFKNARMQVMMNVYDI
jgi:hypothetical protein